MEIRFQKDDCIIKIVNNGISYFLGPNKSGKTHVLDLLYDGFKNAPKNFMVNGRQIKKGEYQIIYLDDVTDFLEEFKLSKNNVFRNLIYEYVKKELESPKTLKDINEIFDRIDYKVGKILDNKVNKNQDEKIKLDIDVTDINFIIEKFTNIYIDDYLLKKDNIPKSLRRKLIYNLLFFRLSEQSDEDIIVLIDDFNIYLDGKNTIDVIDRLNNYHNKNKNVHFFLATSDNIYKDIVDDADIYYLCNDNILRMPTLDSLLEKAILLDKCDELEDFDNFFENTRKYLLPEDIEKEKRKLSNLCLENLGLIMLYEDNNLESFETFSVIEKEILKIFLEYKKNT